MAGWAAERGMRFPRPPEGSFSSASIIGAFLRPLSSGHDCADRQRWQGSVAGSEDFTISPRLGLFGATMHGELGTVASERLGGSHGCFSAPSPPRVSLSFELYVLRNSSHEVTIWPALQAPAECFQGLEKRSVAASVALKSRLCKLFPASRRQASACMRAASSPHRSAMSRRSRIAASTAVREIDLRILVDDAGLNWKLNNLCH